VAATLEGLERDDLVRPATGADAVDGVQAELVAEPASVEEASRVLAAASRAGKKVVVVGNGSKLGLGNPPERVDLILRTRRLDRVLEHAAGDLVVKVEAGARLADLQAALAPAGQWLALDPTEPGATVGGVVAANASGPRRLRYGTVRDLIIGITVVLADGTVAHAGGKVVKNVAGYDLSKLFCGSLGTLGLIAEATFRLHPRPAAAAVVTLQVEGPEQLGEAVRRLLRSTLVPSAIELTWHGPYGPSGLLTVVIEGIRPGVEAQAAAAAELLGEVGEAKVLGPGGTEAALSRLGAQPWERAEVGIKVAVQPAELPGALTDLATGWLGHGRLAAHAGTGVLEVGLGGPNLASAEQVEAFAGVVAKARAALAARGGTLVVTEAPPALKRVVDVWGPPGDAVELMRRVKRQFDPDRQMSPGRFVGGI
jgi:glycolate oxidase FAD binding subunit